MGGDLGLRRVGGLSLGLALVGSMGPPSQTYLLKESAARRKGPSCAQFFGSGPKPQLFFSHPPPLRREWARTNSDAITRGTTSRSLETRGLVVGGVGIGFPPRDLEIWRAGFRQLTKPGFVNLIEISVTKPC